VWAPTEKLGHLRRLKTRPLAQDAPVWRPLNLQDGADWLRRQIDQPEEKPATSTAAAWSLADPAIEQHHNHHNRHRDKHDHGRRHDHKRSRATTPHR
jgi:hypothetical protein